MTIPEQLAPRAGDPYMYTPAYSEKKKKKKGQLRRGWAKKNEKDSTMIRI